MIYSVQFALHIKSGAGTDILFTAPADKLTVVRTIAIGNSATGNRTVSCGVFDGTNTATLMAQVMAAASAARIDSAHIVMNPGDQFFLYSSGNAVDCGVFGYTYPA